MLQGPEPSSSQSERDPSGGMELQEIDRWCDLFEQQRRHNYDYTIPEFLAQHGLTPHPGLLTELGRIADEFRRDPVDALTGNTTLDPGTVSAVRSPASSTEICDAGTRIGGYQLIRMLGEGGMGVVYLADQFAPVRRQVALKLTRPGMNSEQMLARFDTERQSLALMDHPNIAKVLDAGTSRDGRPYFVMEYVDGVPITQYCDGRRLSVTARLQLFASVCHAVQHAHHKGVIHRDLKPSNLLIKETEGEASVRIIDFGLARVAESQSTGSSSCTLFGQIVGTIGYMSPEQASLNSVDIDTRTDVYSLGVLLYELLTGVTPFDVNRLPASEIDELLRIIRYEEPPRASSRFSSLEARHEIAAFRDTDAKRLCRLLRGELDWIAMKALEKERNRRYETPSSLAQDVLRYLEQRPVVAGPPGLAYQMKKFALRNRGMVIASIVIMVSVLAGLVGTTVGLLRALKAEHGTQVEQTLSAWDYGRQLCESGEVGHGLLVLADALESAPVTDAELRASLTLELAAWYQQCDTLQSIFAHPDSVTAIAADPRHSFFVSGCRDGGIRRFRYDSETTEVLGAMNSPVTSIAISPDGCTSIAGSSDGRLLWQDTRTGRTIREQSAHQGEVRAIAFSPDGKTLATGGVSPGAQLWDAVTGEHKQSVSFEGAVRTISYSNDGRWLVIGGGTETAGLFQLLDCHNTLPDKPQLQHRIPRPVLSAAFSPEGQSLLIGDADWETTFWDIPSGRPFAGSDFSDGRVTGISVSADGRYALTGAAESHRAMVWDIGQLRSHWIRQRDGAVVVSRQSAPRPVTPHLPHPAPVTAVAFADPAGATFLTACEDGFVRLWRRAAGFDVHRFVHDTRDRESAAANHVFRVRAAAIDSSEELAATAGEDGRICVWNTADGSPAVPFIQTPAALVAAEFMGSPAILVTCDSENTIRRWSLSSGQEIQPPVVSPSSVSGLSLCPLANLMLTGGDGVAELWTLNPPVPGAASLVHRPDRTDVSIATAISPDGRRLLTCGQDGVARLWTQDGQQLAELSHQNQIRCGAFSPGGQWVATASDDHTVRIWETESGRLMTTLLHESEVFSVTFVSDALILTGGRSGAQLWIHPLMRRIGPPCTTGDDIMCLDSNADGTVAVLGDWDGRGLIWHLPRPQTNRSGSLRDWIETEVGIRLDESGGYETLSGPDWEERRRRSALSSTESPSRPSTQPRSF